MKKTAINAWWSDLLALTVLIGLFFLFYLGSRALSVPDEARYSEIPREMLALHDFITPHLDGVKYFEKPVWMYWVGAAAIKLGGLNAWALRLPTMLMSLIGCLALYAGGRQLFDRRTGLLGALVLATSLLFFAMSHSLTLDMTLSIWLSLSLLSFICAVDLPVGSAARRWLCWAIFATAALAVLTKGLIGMVFPGGIVFFWLLLTNRWRELKNLHLMSGTIIFLLIAAPWHILVQQQNPEFFHFYFVEQHFTRYFTKAMNRYQPWWWFCPILVGGLLPWTFFLPQAIRQIWQKSDRPTRQKSIFLLLWATFIFVFFSLSDSKLIPYLIPVLPPLALLIGHYFSKHWELLPPSARISAYVTLGFLCLISVGLWVAPHFDKHLSAQAVHNLHALAWVSGLWSLAFAWTCIRAKKSSSFFAVLVLGSAVFCWGLVLAVPALDTRPIKSLALTLKSLAGPNDWIVSYGTYYQDLPFYVERQVIIVDWHNELSFGLAHQPEAKQWLLDTATFWQKVKKTHQPIYMVLDQKVYLSLMHEHTLHVIDTRGSDVLVRIH